MEDSKYTVVKVKDLAIVKEMQASIDEYKRACEGIMHILHRREIHDIVKINDKQAPLASEALYFAAEVLEDLKKTQKELIEAKSEIRSLKEQSNNK